LVLQLHMKNLMLVLFLLFQTFLFLPAHAAVQGNGSSGNADPPSVSAFCAVSIGTGAVLTIIAVGTATGPVGWVIAIVGTALYFSAAFADPGCP
jgi:hypothetical protein